MKTIRTTLALAAGLTLLTGAAAGTAAAAPTQLSAIDLDAALDTALADSGAPGATVAVLDRGELVWSGAAGLAVDPSAAPMRLGAASAPAAVAMRTDTLQPIASLTKSYTAVVILRLAEQRKLRLDATIDDWLPAVPGARTVTVRQLLQHTAGYPDVEADPYVTRITSTRRRYDPDHRWTRAELIRLTRAPAFTPGTSWSYSNTNYLLLGEIAERAARAPFARLLDRYVARPLKLRDTLIRRSALPLQRFAHGYYFTAKTRFDTWSAARSVPSDAFGPVWTDGGIATTALDAARFSDGLYRAGALLRPRTLATMTHTPGARFRGHGLGTKRFAFGDGARWQGFIGAYGGYTSMAATNRDSGITIAVLSNQLGIDPVTAPAPAIWVRIGQALGAVPDRAALG
ncbi:serine hydrolase domain-containing protein [Conexibacter woesei]|uniref:Beta-lactamase n=1 Tax=Conexibacter woesei (strain DSM 14684 / CCUG 47730 / CIP 108061 / JCM 11494 / NBRC 100937 / ID131577) TaxID=469383 RepID=D3F638_CONWI|nr:serine hydrolase domain-containing protein [Conexibacter woesei]ADB48711.1 beta-lactamase [Conexibacter woesei DSM 14684]